MTTIRGKNARMDKAIHKVAERARELRCDYKTAWHEWMNEDERQGFTFAQVKYQLEMRGMI